MQITTWKPGLLTLLNYHHLTTPSLAHMSGLQVESVRAMVIWRMPVQQAIAEQVLDGLSRMTGRTYTLDNVDIPVWREVQSIEGG